MYRASSSRARGAPSPIGKIVGRALAVVLALGVCAGALWWFRRAEPAVSADTGAAEEEAAATMMAATVAVAFDASVELAGVNGAAASGTATRSHVGGVYAMGLVANLPPIDSAKTAYEAWYVKPGITDFFSLGEVYPREDGKWGLAWTQTDALVRNDIEEFNRIIVIREPRDGNPAPSADQVLTGGF